MGVRKGTEIVYTEDGPWVTFHGVDSCASYNLRDWVSGLIVAADSGTQKRILQQWMRARLAEGRDTVNEPPKEKEVGRRTRRRA